VDSSHTGKEGAPTWPEGTMKHALTSRRHQSNLKKTIVKLFFLFLFFIWEMVCLLLM
jgi:hypothetical protein